MTATTRSGSTEFKATKATQKNLQKLQIYLSKNATTNSNRQ